MKDKTTPPDGGNDFQILQEDFVHFAGARMCRIYEVTIRGGCTQDLASGYRIRNNFWEKKTQISWKTWQKIIIIKCTYLIQTNPCMQIIYIHLRAHILLKTQLQYQTLDEHTVHHIFSITLCHLFDTNSMFQKRSLDETLPNPQETPSLITRSEKAKRFITNSIIWLGFKWNWIIYILVNPLYNQNFNAFSCKHLLVGHRGI